MNLIRTAIQFDERTLGIAIGTDLSFYDDGEFIDAELEGGRILLSIGHSQIELNIDAAVSAVSETLDIPQSTIELAFQVWIHFNAKKELF